MDDSWNDIKVAMLVRNFSASGGLELYAHKLVEGLLELGLNITVICEKVQTKFVHKKLTIVQIAANKAGSNKAERIDHDFKEFSAALNRLGPFDLVHSHHIGAHPIDVVTFHNHTVFRIEECGTPLEVEINKFKLLFRSDYKLRQKMDAKLIDDANILIFPSKVCKLDYIKHFSLKKPASLVVAYPGWQLADDILFDTHNQANNPNIASTNFAEYDKKRTIVFVGRGYRKKGLDVLLSACSLLKSKNYTFRLLIAGLNKKAIDHWRLYFLGLNDSVSYLGFQKNMNSVYEAASIIVAPGRIEPFGMAVLQGMSYGLVPVVSKVSGVSELLVDEKDSLIIENHLDANELAQKLASLLDHEDWLQQLSVKAQAKARTINWQATINTTLASYRQVFQKQYIV